MKDATKRIEWLESMRELNKAKRRAPLKLITLKIDPDLLEAFKLKCELENSPYTSKIKRLMEEYLKKEQ